MQNRLVIIGALVSKWGWMLFLRNSILRCALTTGETLIIIRCRKTLDHIFRVSKKKASETQKSKVLKRYSHKEHRSSQIIEYDSQLIQNTPIFMNMCNHTYFMSFQMVYFTQTTTRRKFRKRYLEMRYLPISRSDSYWRWG